MVGGLPLVVVVDVSTVIVVDSGVPPNSSVVVLFSAVLIVSEVIIVVDSGVDPSSSVVELISAVLV